MTVIIRRFLEMLGMCVVFSAFIGIIVYLEFLDGNMWGKTRFFTIAAAIVFIILNIISLRKSYFYVRDSVLYPIFNLVAWLMFAVVNVLFYKFTSGFVYGITFGITKALSTALFPSGIAFGNILSAGIFHFVLIVSVFLAPMGMKWVLIEEKE